MSSRPSPLPETPTRAPTMTQSQARNSSNMARTSRLPVPSPNTGSSGFHRSSRVSDIRSKRRVSAGDSSKLKVPPKFPREFSSAKALPSLPIARLESDISLTGRSLMDATDKPLKVKGGTAGEKEWKALSPEKSANQRNDRSSPTVAQTPTPTTITGGPALRQNFPRPSRNSYGFISRLRQSSNQTVTPRSRQASTTAVTPRRPIDPIDAASSSNTWWEDPATSGAETSLPISFGPRSSGPSTNSLASRSAGIRVPASRGAPRSLRQTQSSEWRERRISSRPESAMSGPTLRIHQDAEELITGRAASSLPHYIRSVNRTSPIGTAHDTTGVSSYDLTPDADESSSTYSPAPSQGDPLTFANLAPSHENDPSDHQPRFSTSPGESSPTNSASSSILDLYTFEDDSPSDHLLAAIQPGPQSSQLPTIRQVDRRASEARPQSATFDAASSSPIIDPEALPTTTEEHQSKDDLHNVLVTTTTESSSVSTTRQHRRKPSPHSNVLLFSKGSDTRPSERISRIPSPAAAPSIARTRIHSPPPPSRHTRKRSSIPKAVSAFFRRGTARRGASTASRPASAAPSAVPEAEAPSTSASHALTLAAVGPADHLSTIASAASRLLQTALTSRDVEEKRRALASAREMVEFVTVARETEIARLEAASAAHSARCAATRAAVAVKVVERMVERVVGRL